MDKPGRVHSNPRLVGVWGLVWGFGPGKRLETVMTWGRRMMRTRNRNRGGQLQAYKPYRVHAALTAGNVLLT